MNALVLYDSIHGNTRRIAKAIAAALPGNPPVVHVDQVRPVTLTKVDLLVIGSPTHGSAPTEAVRRYLERLGSPREGLRVAVFDTRLTWRFLARWGGAADKMAATLREKGWPLACEPGGFYVGGLTKGPLKQGEAERATDWAKRLAEGSLGVLPSQAAPRGESDLPAGALRPS